MAYGDGYAGGYAGFTGLSITVEVAFVTDPAATPTWEDISAYLKTFTVHRGRADELSAFSAGQATVTLTNEDRRFDPSYTSSPYSPNVIPMRRIRIRAAYSGTTYDVFNGYVTTWRQVYNPPQDAECVVEATDAFKVLGNITLRNSVWAQEIAADNPTMWFRLDEPAGATSVLDAVGGRTAAVSGATLGAAGLVGRDPGSAMTIGPGGGAVGTTSVPPFTAYPATLSAIVKAAPTFLGSFVQIQDSSGTQGILGLDVNFTNAASASSTISTGTVQGVTGGPAINDNNPHLVTAVWDATGNLRLYTDGVLVAGPNSNVGTLSTPFRIWIATTPGASDNVTVDEVAVFNTAVSAARIATWSAARATARLGELTGARVGWILNAAGWPAADRNIDAGTSTLQGADLGTTALAALQAVEQTEFGALFIAADGKVRFISRTSLLASPYTTSQATFGDSGTELEYGDLTYEYDDRLIVNEAQVSMADGTVQVAADTTSQTKYLRRTKVVSGLLHRSDQTSLDAANWLVAHYKDPMLRVTGLRLEPSAGNESTHFPQVLGRELMDRVTVLRRPQNLGPAISQESMIQGITHTVTADQWVTHWDLSPAETQTYWLAGVAGASEAGQTTRAGF